MRCNSAAYFGKADTLRTLLVMCIFVLLLMLCKIIKMADFMRNSTYLHKGKQEYQNKINGKTLQHTF